MKISRRGRSLSESQRPANGAVGEAVLRSRGIGLVLLACLALGAGGGVRDAVAQVLTPAPAATTPPVDLAPPPVATGAEPQLSPDQMLARAKQFVAGIEQASGSISRQLQAARKDRDVVRVLCLSDKLNQVDVALSSAQDRLNSLRGAVGRADEGRGRHEYTVLEVLNDRVRVLVNESNQCVGEETGFIGEAEVSVSVDPNLPNAETTFDANSNSPPPPPDISSPIQ
jgi:hypothetical protein